MIWLRRSTCNYFGEEDTHFEKNLEMPSVKVQWGGHRKDEATWEWEADVLAKYSDLLNQIS